MAYSPLTFSSLARSAVPDVAKAKPTNLLWVDDNASGGGNGSSSSPFKTIQAAVDKATPGTAVMVKSGTYRESVSLDDASGTKGKPVWLVSADGEGAAKIIASSGKPGISAYGEDYIAIKGFTIQGGTEGIKLTQSGSHLKNLTTNIVIEDNHISGSSIDGIKLAQARYVAVTGNTVENFGREEGIDNVYVRDAVIAYNDISDGSKSGNRSGITVKAGSEDIEILYNDISDVLDGVLVGGWSSKPGVVYPGDIDYQAKDITVLGNHIYDLAKRAVNVLGGNDSVISDNKFDPNNSYLSVVNVASDNQGNRSEDIRLLDNIVDKSKWLTVQSGSSSGLVNDGNTPGGSFDGGGGLTLLGIGADGLNY
ncbi:right-handed parallel beta-helix repeat-containing protein [Skermanella mucosa]|uniref:right-handed parallel beta-helix repeat-containing protein n=1 Tax=Skermanella mucosa TaxID=1789672 RepID=UPI00192A85BA|nr:right-handed parallel beta-helix repeat-containing protein [Skermanella mucosa]UEM20900.1 right-handed parallel beta-helix repeat-containing protein [Skermanella mucosa]